MSAHWQLRKHGRLILAGLSMMLLVACGTQSTPQPAQPPSQPAPATSQPAPPTSVPPTSAPASGNTPSAAAPFQDSGTLNLAVLATQAPWNLDPQVQTGR